MVPPPVCLRWPPVQRSAVLERAKCLLVEEVFQPLHGAVISVSFEQAFYFSLTAILSCGNRSSPLFRNLLLRTPSPLLTAFTSSFHLSRLAVLLTQLFTVLALSVDPRVPFCSALLYPPCLTRTLPSHPLLALHFPSVITLSFSVLQYPSFPQAN